MDEKRIAERVADESIAHRRVGAGGTVRKNVTIVLEKNDFRRSDIWEGMLDSFGISSGEQADWDEPETLTISATKAEYE